MSHGDTVGASPLSRRAFIRFLSLIPLSTPVAHAAIQLADPSAGSKVITTETGLQYYDFIVPQGDKPVVFPHSTVTLHYTLGTTGARNGWRIDSTYDRKPFIFGMRSADIIPGLKEGVLGMKVGAKRRLIIPNTIGYRTVGDKPVPKGFAEYQRFKNIYLNPDRVYKPDVVLDVTIVKVQ